ncbi:DNA-directed RNA polymerase subunit beta [Jeotgalibacillus marinus]|uniref:DNA-directed RNA polymerase subunit beta n=1 Tax=Jeotgalibacillus marinus TaxID=86667 RepID=A0ABV3Q0F2_9BACL
MVGYGVIGDGDPQDVLKKETWTHILDLVMKDAK